MLDKEFAETVGEKKLLIPDYGLENLSQDVLFVGACWIRGRC